MRVQTQQGIFEIHSLDPNIDKVFTNLYKTLLEQPTWDSNDFRSAAVEFFNKVRGDPASQDKFFSNLAPLMALYISNKQWYGAENIWRIALEPAIEWENQNPGELIHKGTPFYFWGMAAISRGELDLGYTLIHQALEEDIRTQNTQHPKTPAFAFAVLDYENVNQAFRDWPLVLARFLENFLISYQTSRGGILQLSQFRSRFLSNPPSLDIVFLFAYALGRFFLLSKIPDYALRSGFSAQLETNLMFDLVLVIDATIASYNQGHKHFSLHAVFLSTQAHLSLSQQMLQEQINLAFQKDFETTLTRLLDGKFTFQDGSSPSLMAADLAISYGLRNYGAHNVSRMSTIWQRFPDIRQSLFNVLFLTVETLC